MFELTRQPATKWDKTAGRPQPISLVPISRGSLSGEKIFTMGSCFALELRHELANLGYETFPKYFDLTFDSGKVAVGGLPDRDNINHYSIASILQEFQNFSSPTPLYSPDYFWDLSDNADRARPIGRFASRIVASTSHRFEVNWQDPFRRNTYAETLDELTSISAAITAKIREGAASANVFIITLGMSEVWIDRRSQLAVCNSYGGNVDEHLCAFADLSAAETREKIAKLVEIIRRINPGATIVFSVSPVPLARTAKNESVVTANLVSKAKQRVAVDDVCREFENVHYFPSFELCLDEEAFEPDGRHVRRAMVNYIVEHFLRWYEGPDGDRSPEGQAAREPALGPRRHADV